MKVAIKVENLSKQYRLGVVGVNTFKEDLAKWVRVKNSKISSLFGKDFENTSNEINSEKYVWSLKDLNFEIHQGDIVGVIGKNGAGKSTLLKILSKVTAPTTGTVKINGRISSLLEVGTGFHPELTGRENIFLNGAILGMKSHEIQRNLDEIIAFSGVEKYIDTPVKRYSSGMYVRLAFAVAAFLESEVLIVDEVLAVGDADFQKKCLGKMGDISKTNGRTILFVSHNMPSISTLCNRAILLNKGSIQLDSSVSECISNYFGGNQKINSLENINLRYKNFFTLNKLEVKHTESKDGFIYDNKEILLEADFEIKNIDPTRLHITFHLYSENGEGLFSFSHDNIKLKINQNKLSFYFPEYFFQSGNYFLHFYLIEDKLKAVLIEEDILCFNVIDGAREIGGYMGREPGYIRPRIMSELN